MAIAAIAARIVMAGLVKPLALLGGGDDAYYLEVATRLFHGCYCVGDHFTSYRPPGYPFFLAVLGAAPGAAIGAQLILGVATACFTWRLLAPKDERLAFLVALLMAANPFLIVYELGIYAEALYVPLVWLALLVLARARRWRQAAGAGIPLGIAVLTRDTLLLLPAAIVILGLVRREWLRRSLIAAGVAFAMALPWQLVTRPADSRAGYALWVGTWERSGSWQDHGIGDAADYPPQAFRSAAEEHELESAFTRGDDRPYRRVALERLRAEPLQTAETWIVRWPRLWIGTRLEQTELRPQRGSIAWTSIKTIGFALNLMLLALAGAGLWLARRTPWMQFAAPVVYAGFVYLPFHNTEPRYSLFALPALCLFAAISAEYVRDLRKNGAAGRIEAS